MTLEQHHILSPMTRKWLNGLTAKINARTVETLTLKPDDLKHLLAIARAAVGFDDLARAASRGDGAEVVRILRLYGYERKADGQ